jgi:hypothetical protein
MLRCSGCQPCNGCTASAKRRSSKQNRRSPTLGERLTACQSAAGVLAPIRFDGQPGPFCEKILTLPGSMDSRLSRHSGRLQWHSDLQILLTVNGVAFITGNDRGRADAVLVRRFRRARNKRERAVVFAAVVREHRDVVLGCCAERRWPDADAAVAAAGDVLIVAHLAMADSAAGLAAGHRDS